MIAGKPRRSCFFICTERVYNQTALQGMLAERSAPGHPEFMTPPASAYYEVDDPMEGRDEGIGVCWAYVIPSVILLQSVPVLSACTASTAVRDGPVLPVWR